MPGSLTTNARRAPSSPANSPSESTLPGAEDDPRARLIIEGIMRHEAVNDESMSDERYRHARRGVACAASFIMLRM